MGYIEYAITALYALVFGLPPTPDLQSQRGLPEKARRNDFGPLRFNSAGTFHISVFEDLHFGKNAWDTWGPQQDVQSVKVIETVLDAEPDIDLVVLNGDLITGDNTFLENSTDYVDQIVRPLARRGLTWASTYGNHDNHFNISAAHILAREKQWPNARTTQMVPGPDTGVSNYYLPVYSADCDPTSSTCPPKLLLWFFDSRGGFRFQQRDPTAPDDDLVPLPNWVDARVVDWFVQTNADLVQASPGGRPIPALAFAHIPTRASRALQDGRAVDPHRQPGIDDDGPLAHQAQGWCPDGTAASGGGRQSNENDGACEYGGQDGPFMRAVSGTPGVMALFSGHDHGESWCARWAGEQSTTERRGKGVSLCFGSALAMGGTGAGSAGPGRWLCPWRGWRMGWLTHISGSSRATSSGPSPSTRRMGRIGIRLRLTTRPSYRLPGEDGRRRCIEGHCPCSRRVFGSTPRHVQVG